METQSQINYSRIARAIEYIRQNFQSQPKLEDIAEYVNMSPFHFQRMFQDWAGVTPKQFLQYLNVEYAKKIIRETDYNLSETAFQTGLSGSGRLHDLFVKIVGMTPGEYKNGGESLKIKYAFQESPFGKLLIASTEKGICHIAFTESEESEEFQKLKARFPRAAYEQKQDAIQHNILSVFSPGAQQLDQVKLHLKGTEFQIKVWEALLKIPTGSLMTYGQIARETGHTKASRAVGTAIGSNPIAFLIPCHRVIRNTGIIGDYRWGSTRKSAIIGWEASQRELQKITE